MLYLSRADVAACGITPARMNDVVEAVFLAEAQGTAWTQPKLALFRPDGNSFRAKAGATTDPSYGAVKWFGYFPGNADRGLPDFWPMVILNEGETGFPVAVMDATWISASRTASVTAAAARHLARKDAKTVGFIACGTQARANLDALAAAFPLQRVTAYSRNPRTSSAFAEAAAARGLKAIAVTDPRDAVRGHDIVVSSVPHASPSGRFLDAADVSPGTFVSMVDLGYGWRKETLGRFDRIVTTTSHRAPQRIGKAQLRGTLCGGSCRCDRKTHPRTDLGGGAERTDFRRNGSCRRGSGDRSIRGCLSCRHRYIAAAVRATMTKRSASQPETRIQLVDERN